MTAALANFDADHWINQIANGAYLRDIAKQVGISKQAISKRLQSHPEYAAAKEAAIECQLDDAHERILNASDLIDIGCAREAWRAATWRAERETERWAPKRDQVQAAVVVILAADQNALLQAVSSARQTVVRNVVTIDSQSDVIEGNQ